MIYHQTREPRELPLGNPWPAEFEIAGLKNAHCTAHLAVKMRSKFTWYNFTWWENNNFVPTFIVGLSCSNSYLLFYLKCSIFHLSLDIWSYPLFGDNSVRWTGNWQERSRLGSSSRAQLLDLKWSCRCIEWKEVVGFCTNELFRGTDLSLMWFILRLWLLSVCATARFGLGFCGQI